MLTNKNKDILSGRIHNSAANSAANTAAQAAVINSENNSFINKEEAEIKNKTGGEDNQNIKNFNSSEFKSSENDKELSQKSFVQIVTENKLFFRTRSYSAVRGNGSSEK